MVFLFKDKKNLSKGFIFPMILNSTLGILFLRIGKIFLINSFHAKLFVVLARLPMNKIL